MKATHPRIANGLSVVRLGKTDWRVSAGSNPEDLLGYIERQRGGRFEIVWMSDPMRWGYVASFDAALVAFADSSRFAGEIRDARARVTGVQREPLFAPSRRSSWVKPRGHSNDYNYPKRPRKWG